jgi:hypothetical protein
MKKLITLIAVFISLAAMAQDPPAKVPELNCYNKWAQKFEERGSEDVADGAYTDVIVTFRHGAIAECFEGKAMVKEKKVEGFYILLDDGSYEQVVRVWKNDPKDINITNGISKTLITKDNQLINVIWPKKIKAKKAGFKKAPEPVDD